MNYIGVDCHISSLDFAVVNEKGTITQKAKVNTGVKEFMEFVKSIPKPRKIFIEEGELAGWMLETSLKFGEELIITDPKINKWIGKAGQKNDPIDAEKLAQLARGKYIDKDRIDCLIGSSSLPEVFINCNVKLLLGNIIILS